MDALAGLDVARDAASIALILPSATYSLSVLRAFSASLCMSFFPDRV
jgi:hypothetical protein